MATKQRPTKKTRPAKKASKKRPRKAPAEQTTTKRQSKESARAGRPTKPAKSRTKRAASKSGSVSVSAPPPVSAPASIKAPAPVKVPAPSPVVPSEGAGRREAASSRPPSYLESVPRDHAELVSGLFRVVRGAAKDIKTLVTQAIAMSNQKNDRSRR